MTPAPARDEVTLNDATSNNLLYRENVLAFLKTYSVKVALPGQEFKLASGGSSRLYIDAKRTYLHRQMHAPVARLLHEEIKKVGLVDAVAGVVLGGCHLASIVAASAAIRGESLYSVIHVRKEPKDHGTHHIVEAAWTPRLDERVVVIEDVLSTGRSALAAACALSEEGYGVKGIVALVDRRRVGDRSSEIVAPGLPTAPFSRAFPVRSVFKLEDLDLHPDVTT